MNTEDELNEIVRGISAELEACVEGTLRKRENGDYAIADDADADDTGDSGDAVTAFDYIEECALSVENWKINKDGECVGGEIQFCWGGPSVWATEEGVFGAWGGSRCDWYSSKAGDAVLDYLKETMPTR